jgi:hypothetical protein
MRMNSWERRHILHLLDDRALLWDMQNTFKNLTKYRDSFKPATTYEEFWCTYGGKELLPDLTERFSWKN